MARGELSPLDELAEIPFQLHSVGSVRGANGLFGDTFPAQTEILVAQLDLQASDLQRMILTGSFGSQLNVEAVSGLGMIPAVDQELVETSANGAGFGAALFLNDDEFARGERIAEMAEQVGLDLDADFNLRYFEAMDLSG